MSINFQCMHKNSLLNFNPGNGKSFLGGSVPPSGRQLFEFGNRSRRREVPAKKMSPSRSCQCDPHIWGKKRWGRLVPKIPQRTIWWSFIWWRWALVLSHFFDAGSVAVMLLHVLTKVMLGELQIDTYSQTFQDT